MHPHKVLSQQQRAPHTPHTPPDAAQHPLQPLSPHRTGDGTPCPWHKGERRGCCTMPKGQQGACRRIVKGAFAVKQCREGCLQLRGEACDKNLP